MSTDKSLKFFRAASAPASAAVGAIWFDTTNRTIQIKTGASTWEPYAGKLKDSSWNESSQSLTITKYDGSEIVLDFSNVASLANVAAAITDAVTPVTNRVTAAEGKISALETKVGAPAVEGGAAATGLFKALADEKSARESADTALGGRVDEVAVNLATETAERKAADEGLDGRLSTVEGKVTGLASATHFLGVKASLDEVTSPANGDIVIVGQKEYVYTTDDTSWHEMGDTSSEVGRITALETRMDTAESDIDTLQSGLASEIERAKGAEQANATAIAAETQRATAAEQANAAAIAQEVTDRANAITAAIEALDVESTTKSSADGKVSVKYSQTDGKVSISEVSTSNIASASDLTALSEKVTTMDGSLGVAKTDITALKALHADGDGGAKKTVKAEITEAISGLKVDSTTKSSTDGKVSVTYSQTDGKVMISEVATSDIASAAGLSQAQSDISDLKTRMSTAEGEIDTLQTDLTAEVTRAKAAEEANAAAILAETNRATARENELDAKIGASIASALVWEEF